MTEAVEKKEQIIPGRTYFNGRLLRKGVTSRDREWTMAVHGSVTSLVEQPVLGGEIRIERSEDVEKELFSTEGLELYINGFPTGEGTTLRKFREGNYKLVNGRWVERGRE